MINNVANSGLKRIILVNSYISTNNNKIFEFDFSTHTQVNGANGSGKTSLLKLIPFFYGADPGRITTLSNVKKSFSGYYLPYPDSHIVFEYYNYKHDLVHVIVSNATSSINNTTLAYKFVPSPFDVADIIKIENNVYTIKSWLEYKDALREKHIKPEAIINSVETYRNIIQNISSGDNSYLRQFYSLSKGRQELRYVDSIALSLITGKIDFDNIKLLLTEIIKRDHNNTNLALKENDITKWCHEVDAYNAIVPLTEEFNNIISKYSDYTDYEKILRKNSQFLNFFDHDLKRIKKELENQKNIEENSKTKFIAENQDIINALNNKVGEIDGAKNQKLDTINKIEQQQEQYLEQNAALWLDKYLNKSTTENRLQEELKIQDKLLGDSKDIEDSFNLEEQKLTSTYNINNVKLNNKLSELNSQKTKELFELEANKNEQINKNNKTKQDLLAAQNEIIINLNNTNQQLQFAKKHIDIPEDLDNQKKDIEQNKARLQKIINETQKTHNKLVNSKHNLENERRDITSSCLDNKKKLRDAESRKNYIDRYLGADDSMFIGYLNEHVPSWRNNIGKVIDSKLLERTDLKPKINENTILDSENINLGNITIDVTNVQRTFKEEDELKYERSQLIETLVELSKLDEDYEKKLDDLTKQIDSLTAEITQLPNIDSIEKEIAEKDEQLILTLENIENYKKQEEQNIALKISETIKNIQIQEQETKKIQKQYESLNEEIYNNFECSKSDIDTKFANLSKNIKEEIAKSKDQYDNSLASLKAIKNSKLAKKGIDEKLITENRERVDSLKNELELLESKRALIDDYTVWKNTSGDNLNRFRQEYVALQADYTIAKKEAKEAQNEHNNKVKNFDSEITRLKNEIAVKEEQIKEISGKDGLGGIKEKLQSYNLMSVLEVKPDTPFTNIINDTKSYYRKYEQAYDDILGYLDTIQKKMRSSANDTEIESWWRESTAIEHSPIEFVNNESDNQKNIAIGAYSAKAMIEHRLPSQKRLLMSQGKNITHMITEYHYQISSFDNRIKNFSNRISSIVSNNLQFEAFDEFSIHLETKIKKIKALNYVEDIAKYYEQWSIEGAPKGELPSVSFVNKMKNFAEQFQNGQLHNELSELFEIVFEVVENGKRKKASRASELENLSSNGLTFLLICALFISLINEAKNGQPINVHWPVDEMSKLSNTNIHLLMQIMNNNFITMVSAAPDLSTAVAQEFSKIYRITREGVYMNAEAIDPLGAEIDNLLADDNDDIFISPNSTDTTNTSNITNGDNL